MSHGRPMRLSVLKRKSFLSAAFYFAHLPMKVTTQFGRHIIPAYSETDTESRTSFISKSPKALLSSNSMMIGAPY